MISGLNLKKLPSLPLSLPCQQISNKCENRMKKVTENRGENEEGE